MGRWRWIFGLWLMAWPLLACAQEPQGDRRGAREALKVFAWVPAKLAPMMRMSVATLVEGALGENAPPHGRPRGQLRDLPPFAKTIHVPYTVL